MPAAWIFNNTGSSVFAVSLFHAVDNTALLVLPEVETVFPLGPALTCGAMVAAAGIVAWAWGPRTMARFRFG